MTLPGLGPLPTIVKRVFAVGDVVVYGGFVFTVKENKECCIAIENACGDCLDVPAEKLSLL